MAETDLAEQFLRVVSLIDPPATLLHPRMRLRAVRPRRRKQAEAQQPTLSPA